MIHNIVYILNYTFLIFAFLIITSYFVLSLISIVAIVSYMRKNSFTSYNKIETSPIVPSISLIAPAYNEELNICENIRSLLSIHYANIEIIIVNDGSIDQSLQKMIDEYELVPVNIFYDEKIKSKEIRNIYKSKNNDLNKLTVIDKVNGGKADALNAGINYSKNELIACIDVDCVLAEDALIKMVKPFLESTNKKIIAVGGSVRIANDCKIIKGKLIRTHLSKKILPKIQILEYIRAFLLGRMGWGHLEGLLLISGAFGLFDKKTVIDCGGYNTKTVGEDMELVVRMRRYMYDKKIPYSAVYIPDPLCWTEVPDNYKTIINQRNRWTRGTIETLWIHRKLFFNPKYKILGMVSFPFWFFFEWLAPIVEFIGIIYVLFLMYFGMFYYEFSLILLLAVYSFAVLYSAMAILIEELTYHQYFKISSILKLFAASLIEPIIYHPVITFAAVQGNFDKFFRRKNGWGKMKRKGFNNGKS